MVRPTARNSRFDPSADPQKNFVVLDADVATTRVGLLPLTISLLVIRDGRVTETIHSVLDWYRVLGSRIGDSPPCFEVATSGHRRLTITDLRVQGREPVRTLARFAQTLQPIADAGWVTVLHVIDPVIASFENALHRQQIRLPDLLVNSTAALEVALRGGLRPAMLRHFSPGYDAEFPSLIDCLEARSIRSGVSTDDRSWAGHAIRALYEQQITELEERRNRSTTT